MTSNQTNESDNVSLETLKGKDLTKEFYGLGKFESCYNASLARALYDCLGVSGEDEAFGDCETIGYHALFKLDELGILEDGKPIFGCISSETSDGSFTYQSYETEDELTKAWDELKESKKLEPIEDYPSEDEYEETITEIYGQFKIGELSFDAGKILRELDEVAFRCGISDSLRFKCPICEETFEDSDDAKDCCQSY